MIIRLELNAKQAAGLLALAGHALDIMDGLDKVEEAGAGVASILEETTRAALLREIADAGCDHVDQLRGMGVQELLRMADLWTGRARLIDA